MHSLFIEKEYKGNTYNIFKKEFRNFRRYSILINGVIKDNFSIICTEYHKENFLIEKLIEFLHKKHF